MLGRSQTISVRHRRSGAERRRGSTLIELLVVIAIIAMLIAVLLPSLRRSIALASSVNCSVHLREIGTAVRMYWLENDGWLPVPDAPSSRTATATVGIGGVTEPPSENTAWFVKLFPTYLQDGEILTCPDDPFAFRMKQARNRLADPLVADFASYGMNSFLLTYRGGMLANRDRHAPSRPGETILLCDLGPDRIDYSNPRGVVARGPARNSSLVDWSDSFDPIMGTASRPWVTARHQRGINVVTVNGNVRHVSTIQMIKAPIRRFYTNCAAGDCPLCKELSWYHYSFAHDRLYWWTGPLPKE